jgi:hypothetical protein
MIEVDFEQMAHFVKRFVTADFAVRVLQELVR